MNDKRMPIWVSADRPVRWSAPAIDASPLAFHRARPGYAPTVLAEAPALAAELGVRRVFVKDESNRLGLPAFKILGASWAIEQALASRPGPVPTLVAATDGNHGRAVARVAAQRGTTARIFVPADVHPAAVAAIAAEGATVLRIDGSYAAAVAAAAADVGRSGGLLVQDMAWPGYEQIPAWIVAGYTTMFTEIDEQLASAGAAPASLVVIPVGVGSLAQAAITHYRRPGLADPPGLLSVEPEAAACVLRSLERGQLTTVGTSATIMSGLNCGTPSSAAWPCLRSGLDAAVAVTDGQAAAAARDLAAAGVPAGPCGAAPLAGARAVLADRRGRARLGITASSTVILLSTESSAANPVSS